MRLHQTGAGDWLEQDDSVTTAGTPNGVSRQEHGAGREGCWPWPAASPDDPERKPRRAAAAHQRGDLVPVDVIGGGLGQRPRDPQPGELPYPPFMHEQVVVVDRLKAWSCLRRFHRQDLLPVRIPRDHARIAKLSPNPQKLLVLARDLLVMARDLLAAGQPMTSGTDQVRIAAVGVIGTGRNCRYRPPALERVAAGRSRTRIATNRLHFVSRPNHHRERTVPRVNGPRPTIRPDIREAR